MPTITAITHQKRTPGRYSIFIDDAFAFGISEEALFEEKLHVGLELSAQAYEHLKIVVDKDKTYQKVLHYLEFRPRSINEIKTYLRRQSPPIEDEYAKEIVAKLERLGYLNDQTFAQWYVEQRREKGKRWGTHKIKIALYQLGVDEKVIEKALETSKDSVPEKDIALEEANKVFKRMHEKDPYKAKKKFMDALARRGFSWDVIKEIVAEFDFG